MLDKTPYTPGLREILRMSKAEAGRLGHDYIGAEHYLLAIIRKEDSLASKALEHLEVDLKNLKLEIERTVVLGVGPTEGLIPPNESARTVLENARLLADSMKHRWVGAEHLLLALSLENDSIPSKCLQKRRVHFDDIERTVKHLLYGGS